MAAQSVTSAVVKDFVATAASRTVCISDQQGLKRETPTLPLELLREVIEYAIKDARLTRDGTILCKLMHVSCSTRYLVVAKAFDEVELYDCESPRKASIEAVRIPCRLVTELHDRITRHKLRDFSTRCSGRASRGLTGEKYEKLIRGNEGSLVTAFTARVQITQYSFRLQSGGKVTERRVSRKEKVREDDNDSSGVPLLSVWAVLESVLETSSSLRLFYPYQRALMASFEVPERDICMQVTLDFRLRPHDYPRYPICVALGSGTTAPSTLLRMTRNDRLPFPRSDRAAPLPSLPPPQCHHAAQFSLLHVPSTLSTSCKARSSFMLRSRSGKWIDCIRCYCLCELLFGRIRTEVFNLMRECENGSSS